MEVNLLKIPDAGFGNPNVASITPANTGTEATKSSSTVVRSTASQDTLPKEEKSEAQVSKDELSDITAALNKFVTSLNADLHFAVHNKTKELMVQLVDEKQHKVLKEFPPHEFLDMIAKIRDFVGVLLDKKA